MHRGVSKYTTLFSIEEISKHPVFHPGGFDVFVTQPLCVGVYLFPAFYDKTTSLFRGLSSIIRSTCPYHLGALVCTFLEIKFLNVIYDTNLGMSAPCMRSFYPVLETGTSSNGMSWPMKIFCMINFQCSGTG